MHATATTAASPPPPTPAQTCAQGHRSTLILATAEGGAICLLCLSNLLCNPKSPTVHISYALSQLSLALSQPHFLRSLLSFHSLFLVSPLVSVLSNFDDEPLANQTINLIVKICDASSSYGDGDDVCNEFIVKVVDRISSGSLAWSRRQLYMLHCLGVLLDNQENGSYVCIKDKDALVCNLVTGLQLSSEDIQGEIMFVLYKMSVLGCTFMDDNCCDMLLASRLLHLSLEALMKTQSDDVRLNCLAFLTVLAKRGHFQDASANLGGSTDSSEADNFMQTSEHMAGGSPFEVLLAEAVKGPLLSSDSQVQIAALDLILLYLSWEGFSAKEAQVLVEENLADYILEILRLSGCKDPVVNTSIQVLDLLSTAEPAFRQRLSIGFTTLVSILRHVAEVPFHPALCKLLKLISTCVSSFPGATSSLHIEEISTILAGMLIKHIAGQIGMLPETFTLSCSILVDLLKCSCSNGNSTLLLSIRDASRSAVSTCLSCDRVDTDQMLHSLNLLKEAYAYGYEDNLNSSTITELRNCVLDICTKQILPWFMTVIYEIEDEDVAVGVIETFQCLLLRDSNTEIKTFTDTLVSSSWFSALFGCLGLFPTEKMKWRVYLIFASIVDVLLGSDSGQPIRDAALNLPCDPIDLLFLLGQKSSHGLEFVCCQSAILLILYVSSLYNDRIADDKLVLASLEQYIILNSCEFRGASAPLMLEILANLYGLYRGLAKMSYQVHYSSEAERTLFQLLAENDWDSLSTGIHLTSLKWLFQQEKLCKPLSKQVLKFCKCESSISTCIVLHKKANQNVDIRVIAELVASEDNFGATIFVCLLGDLLESPDGEFDIISVLSAITKIIGIAPISSDQFCLHGISGAIQKIYFQSNYFLPELYRVTSQFIFSFLLSVSAESISSDEAWVGITRKLVDSLIAMVAADGWAEDSLMIIGILSLVLHHSTNQALTEASKHILLSEHLASTINNTVLAACSKGPALLDDNEETSTGELLVFVLSLLFFSLRSGRATLPGIIDFKTLIEYDDVQPMSYVGIRCHNLCKLMHFGSPSTKLIASYCLLEIITEIANQRSKKRDEIKLKTGQLHSIKAVLEGLIFSGDIRVSVNSSRCLSVLMTMEEMEIASTTPEHDSWCRLIVEELVISLATPSAPSNSFIRHHIPAVNVAVSLLRMNQIPPWMASVFDDSSTFSIIQNLSWNNVSPEVVLLFRQLLDAGFLKSEHATELNKVFQACRRHMHTDEMLDATLEEQKEKMAVDLEDLKNACSLLTHLLSSQYDRDMDLPRSQRWKKQVLEEIKLFTRCLTAEDEG